MRTRMIALTLAAGLLATGGLFMSHRHMTESAGASPVLTQPLPSGVDSLPLDSQREIQAFAERNPRAYERALATAKRRGWKEPGTVAKFGSRLSRHEIVERNLKLNRDGRADVRPAQYFADSAGEVWAWEWNCGDGRFCADMVIYGNAYGEELSFAVEFTPYSESDGAVTWSEPYTYDPGVLFGEENEGQIPVDWSGDIPNPMIIETQGGVGACIVARVYCLGRALDYNWTKAFLWSGAGSMVTCAPWWARITFGGYLACVGFGTAVGGVTGFVQQVVEQAPQCAGSCTGGLP